MLTLRGQDAGVSGSCTGDEHGRHVRVRRAGQPVHSLQHQEVGTSGGLPHQPGVEPAPSPIAMIGKEEFSLNGLGLVGF